MTDYSDNKKTNGLNLVKSYPEKKKFNCYGNWLSYNCVIKINPHTHTKLTFSILSQICF